MLRSVSSRLLASRIVTAPVRLPAASRPLCSPPGSVFLRRFTLNPSTPPPPSPPSTPTGSSRGPAQSGSGHLAPNSAWYGPGYVESDAASSSQSSDAAAIAELQAQYPFPINFRPRPLTPEEHNQADWARFADARMNLMVFALMLGGVLIVRYWYHRELDHFQHHRHRQEPYAFFINRDNEVAAGFWPGRSCQFLEFNCFAAVYDQAEKMLREKQEEHAAAAPAGGGDQHDDKKAKH